MSEHKIQFLNYLLILLTEGKKKVIAPLNHHIDVEKFGPLFCFNLVMLGFPT